jgi:hypothetical protein
MPHALGPHNFTFVNNIPRIELKRLSSIKDIFAINYINFC